MPVKRAPLFVCLFLTPLSHPLLPPSLAQKVNGCKDDGCDTIPLRTYVGRRYGTGKSTSCGEVKVNETGEVPTSSKTEP